MITAQPVPPVPETRSAKSTALPIGKSRGAPADPMPQSAHRSPSLPPEDGQTSLYRRELRRCRTRHRRDEENGKEPALVAPHLLRCPVLEPTGQPLPSGSLGHEKTHR